MKMSVQKQWEKWCRDNKIPVATPREISYQIAFGALGYELTEKQKETVEKFYNELSN